MTDVPVAEAEAPDVSSTSVSYPIGPEQREAPTLTHTRPDPSPAPTGGTTTIPVAVAEASDVPEAGVPPRCAVTVLCAPDRVSVSLTVTPRSASLTTASEDRSGHEQPPPQSGLVDYSPSGSTDTSDSLEPAGEVPVVPMVIGALVHDGTHRDEVISVSDPDPPSDSYSPPPSPLRPASPPHSGVAPNDTFRAVADRAAASVPANQSLQPDVTVAAPAPATLSSAASSSVPDRSALPASATASPHVDTGAVRFHR